MRLDSGLFVRAAMAGAETQLNRALTFFPMIILIGRAALTNTEFPPGRRNYGVVQSCRSDEPN
jgi:hypothetical protein